MKNKKRFGFLSAVIGLCLSATSIFGTTAFATEGEGGEAQPPVYAAQSDIVDIVFAKNKVDYFTADGKVVDYFNEIELSPLHTKKEFPYIPSFACLLRKVENEKIKAFVENQIAIIGCA